MADLIPTTSGAGLTLANAASVAWTGEAARWRAALATGHHPTTGEPHDRESCLFGIRTCLRFARWARETVQPQTPATTA